MVFYFKMNVFPVEILENILLKCDGKTLFNIKRIDDNWKSLVEFITKHSDIWKWCCKEEIPKNELLDYCEKYNGQFDDYRMWLKIYQNWYSWQNLCDIQYGIDATPVDLFRISCMAVSVTGNYIAVGSEDGRLKIYKSTWTIAHSARYLAVKIRSISFIHFKGEDQENTYIVLAHTNGIVIAGINNTNNDVDIMHDIKNYSVYKNYICYERVGGRFTICELSCHNGRLIKKDIWFSRIYSPTSVGSMNMWNGICTFLITNKIKYVNYNSTDMSPVELLRDKAKLHFSFATIDGYFILTELILRDNVIVIIYKNEDREKCEFIEFFFLNEDESYSTKLFNSWEIFKSTITCIFVYGNILILGDDIGNIYLYHVSSWKNLNLRNYGRKIIIGRHPIININVQEGDKDRKFFIASRFCVHQLTGYGYLQEK